MTTNPFRFTINCFVEIDGRNIRMVNVKATKLARDRVVTQPSYVFFDHELVKDDADKNKCKEYKGKIAVMVPADLIDKLNK